MNRLAGHSIATLLAVAASTGAALAAGPEYGNAAAGLTLARQWCASCHVVEQGQSMASQSMAPTFEKIAEGFSPERRESLNAWLTVPHGPMQDLSLSRQQIADILSYVQSLAK